MAATERSGRSVPSTPRVNKPVTRPAMSPWQKYKARKEWEKDNPNLVDRRSPWQKNSKRINRAVGDLDLGHKERQSRYRQNAIENARKKGRFDDATKRRIQQRLGQVSQGVKRRESNFAVSQRDVINKRFGGDVNKALEAMRREAARQAARKRR